MLPIKNQLHTLLLLAALASSCSMPLVVTNNFVSYPPHPITPSPGKFFVANGYNVMAESYRDTKKELFLNLTGEATGLAAVAIENGFDVPAILHPGFTAQIGNRDSLHAYFEKYEASHAVIITRFDAYFDQTGVDVVETSTGKERTANYDIILTISYSLRDRAGHRFDTTIFMRKYHSSRSVVSGLLAAGPSIVSNSDDARSGIRHNIALYLRSFIKVSEQRNRYLYVTKDLKPAGEAFKLSDFETAMTASEKLTTSSDAKLASRAYYNCAVLAEHAGQFEKVKGYLKESLRLQPGFLNAKYMMEDYRFQ